MAIKKSTDKGAKKEVSEETVQIVKENDDVVTVSKSLLEDLQRDIAELKKKQIVSSEEEYDLRDDYLEEPAIFFSFSTTYGIYGDKRYNQEVSAPRGENILFKKLYRYSKRTSKRGLEVVSVSQVVIRSRETAEWLRNHSLFNIKFFESIEKVQNVNVTLAEKMTEQNAVVSSMNDFQIVERCKSLGIPIVSGEIDHLRKVLVRNLAESAMKREDKKTEITLAKADRDENNRQISIGKIGVGDVDRDVAAPDAY